MQIPDLRNPKRAATPSIRGYYFQFLCTLQRWLAIGEKELIWCEGNEDIDRMMADGSLVEEQVKHLAGKITDASSAITSTMLNFAQGFTHNHRRGYRSFHIFRTTAELGDIKDQNLAKWLKDRVLTPSNIDGLMGLIGSLASQKNDDSMNESLSYISANGLEQEFFESCSWVFSEISYDEMLRRFYNDIIHDDRCCNTDPESIIAAAVSNISKVSSCDYISERCLSRYDFDCLVNNLQISKVATKYNYRGTFSERAVAVASTAKTTSAVVLRFHDINGIRSSLQECIEYVLSHPDGPDDDDLNSVFRSDIFLNRLKRIDFDAYIAYGNIEPVRRRQVKERWLARRTIKMSSFRDYGNSTVAMDDSLRRVLYSLSIPDYVRTEGDEDLLALTHTIAKWVLEIVNEPSNKHKLFSISKKIRCVCKWDVHQFSTQEDSFEEWFASS
jgi:hypothetical protein